MLKHVGGLTYSEWNVRCLDGIKMKDGLQQLALDDDGAFRKFPPNPDGMKSERMAYNSCSLTTRVP